MSEETKTIDTSNKFCVGLIGDDVAIMRPPRSRITKEEALNLAAWLVALAGTDEQFKQVFDAVCSGQ